MESAKTTTEGFAMSSQSLRYGGFKLKKVRDSQTEKQRQQELCATFSNHADGSVWLLSNQLFMPNLPPEQKTAARSLRPKGRNLDSK